MSQAKKKNLLIGGLLAVVVVMGIAYAAFASNLNITGTANTTNNWGVRIKSIAATNPSVDATCSDRSVPSTCTTTGNISASKTDDLSATFSASLINPGDSVTYTIVIENYGDLDAKLDSITMPESSNTAISFSRGGITVGNKISSKGEEELTVTVTYVDDPNGQGKPAQNTSNLTVTLNFVQDDGTGSAVSGGSNLTTVYAYHTDTKRIGTSTITDGVSDYTQLSSYQNGKTWFLKYDIDGDNVIQNAYACMKFTFINNPICLQGGYLPYYGTNSTGNRGTIEGLSTTFSSQNPAGSCSSDDYGSSCNIDTLYISADSNDRVYAGIYDDEESIDQDCHVGDGGDVYCAE